MTSQGQRDLDRIAGQVGLNLNASVVSLCFFLMTGLGCEKGISCTCACVVLLPLQNKFHFDSENNGHVDYGALKFEKRWTKICSTKRLSTCK